MPTLKEIGNISQLCGASLLSASPIWNKEVDKIDFMQLHAFVRRLTDEGKRDQAETAVEIILAEVIKAVERGEIVTPKILLYERSTRIALMAGELRDGLLTLGQPHAAAILFGLEMGLDAIGVSSMTRHKLYKIDNNLTSLARNCTRACPRHFMSPYVFWLDRNEAAMPLFGLDHAVFEAFGLVWGELAEGYRNLIMIDSEADATSFNALIR